MAHSYIRADNVEFGRQYHLIKSNTSLPEANIVYIAAAIDSISRLSGIGEITTYPSHSNGTNVAMVGKLNGYKWENHHSVSLFFRRKWPWCANGKSMKWAIMNGVNDRQWNEQIP